MTQIIPTEIIDNYLKSNENTPRYYHQQITEIHKVLEDMIDEMADCTRNRRFVVVTGSQGAGKSYLTSRLTTGLNEAGIKPLHVDAEEIMGRIPNFNTDRVNSQHYVGDVNCDMDKMREALHEVTLRWRPAAKYIADRLINAAAERGVDVVYETTGQAEHFDSFLKQVQKNGYAIDAHACEARLSLKVAAFERRAMHDQDIYFLPEELEKTHQRTLGNLAAVANFSNALTVYWRNRIDEPAMPVARMEGASAIITDSKNASAFNEYMIERKSPGIAELALIKGGNGLAPLAPAMATPLVIAPAQRPAAPKPTYA